MNIRLKYAKYGSLRFVGHLDMLRYLQKAVRRSGIDAVYTEGFNPHLIMSFAQPLGVGVTSDGEYVDMELHQSSDTVSMIEQLNSVVTDGFKITGFYHRPEWELNQRKDTAMSLVAAADYKVSMKYADIISKEDLRKGFLEFAAQDEIKVIKQTKKHERELDLKPFLYAYAFEADEFSRVTGQSLQNILEGTAHAEGYEADNCLYIQLAAGSAVNIKPELVMEAFFQSRGMEVSSHSFQVHRMEMYQDAQRKGMSQIEIEKALNAGELSERRLISMAEV